MEHTQGKLQINHSDPFQICDADGEVRGCAPVAQMVGTTSEKRANARRLVACWNACDGIPTYQLFGEADAPNNLGGMIDALRADKAELLAALQYLLGPKDDEKIGWHRNTGHATLMTCEFCAKSHEDITLIEHQNDCPVTVARTAAAKHSNKGAEHG